jgi:hypothetical protein
VQNRRETSLLNRGAEALVAGALGTTPIPSSPGLPVNPEASDSCPVYRELLRWESGASHHDTVRLRDRSGFTQRVVCAETLLELISKTLCVMLNSVQHLYLRLGIDPETSSG